MTCPIQLSCLLSLSSSGIAWNFYVPMSENTNLESRNWENFYHSFEKYKTGLLMQCHDFFLLVPKYSKAQNFWSSMHRIQTLFTRNPLNASRTSRNLERSEKGFCVEVPNCVPKSKSFINGGSNILKWFIILTNEWDELHKATVMMTQKKIPIFYTTNLQSEFIFREYDDQLLVFGLRENFVPPST